MIINPLFFYMMYLANNISIALVLLGCFAVLGGAFYMFFAFDNFSGEKESRAYKCGKRFILLGIVMFFIGMLIPDKETLLLMQAARLATTDNVNAVFDGLKAAMDYAVSILK